MIRMGSGHEQKTECGVNMEISTCKFFSWEVLVSINLFGTQEPFRKVLIKRQIFCTPLNLFFSNILKVLFLHSHCGRVWEVDEKTYKPWHLT
jgi:hypothetical protein